VLYSFKDLEVPIGPALGLAEFQKRCRQAADLVADTPEAIVFLRRLVETFPGEERVLGAVQEYEAFLKRHPDTPDALAILQTLRETYASLKVPDPAARCEMLMREAPFPRETRRAFYAQSALGWTGWQIVGPFQAAGDRRGMNVTLPPERSVDPDWQPKGPFNVDLRWIKWAPPKDEKGRPPGYGYVELTPLLLSRFDRRQQEDILRGPYFAYAYRRLEVGSRRRAALLFGCRDVVSIWLNGRRVVTESVPGDSRDGQAVDVSLNAGENEILLKLATPEGRLGFFFRLADENGRPFDDLQP